MSFIFQFLAQFFAGFGIGFWKGWKLALVMMSLTPVLAICGAFMSKVNKIIAIYFIQMSFVKISNLHKFSLQLQKTQKGSNKIGTDINRAAASEKVANQCTESAHLLIY